MREFVIYFDRENMEILKVLKTRLENDFGGVKHACTFHTTDFCYMLLFAVVDDDFSQFLKTTESFVIKFVLDKKMELINQFFLDKDYLDCSRMETIKTFLFAFDKESDINLTKRLFQPFQDSIKLEEFYSFTLKPLKDKWANLINLATENLDLFVEDDGLIEFTKFLVENSSVESEFFFIEKQNNNYLITTDKEKKIVVSDYDSLSGILNQIIKYMPMKVIVNNCNNVDVVVLSALRNIMQEKLILNS